MRETRSAKIQVVDDAELTIEGWPVRFEEPTTIHAEGGDYREVIHRHALDNCDMGSAVLVVNHDSEAIPLARAGKTMSFEVTDQGLHMVASLAGDSQTAKDAYAAVRRGDLAGMSFAFKVAEGGSRFDGMTNTRHISKIETIFEVSLCSAPAYTTATVEARDAMRAARDMAREGLCSRIAKIRALARAKRILSEEG